MSLCIRDEEPVDFAAIRALAAAAFKGNEHSNGTEGAIIDALRKDAALTLSLVASIDGDIVGHVAFSPVVIDGRDMGWFGLGPVAVRPDRQRRGIGTALIRAGLARLSDAGAGGCVVLGDPIYYRRFGFENDPTLRFDGAPADYFMRLTLNHTTPSGRIAYHRAFDAS